MKIVLIFSFRHDYNLVPDLIDNVSGFIDDYVSWDDRNNKGLYFHEGKIRRHLITEAKKKGADWILGMDPDERFERTAEKKIKILTKSKEKIIYGFHYRELYTPSQYRIDGVWGGKKRFSLFPAFEDQKFMNLQVHQPWHPINNDYKFVETELNLYHLKMIDPQNRKDRKFLFNKLDPGKKIQKIGYDYLDDEKGMKLKRIPFRRRYIPAYKQGYVIKQFGDEYREEPNFVSK